jgi:ArsR family transcriptional regulator
MNYLLTILKALSDETRFKLIHMLLNQDLCGRALARRLAISEAAVSQHLKILKKAGLIKGERRGYWTHYAVQTEVLAELIGELERMARQSKAPTGHCHRLRAANSDFSGREVKTMCCGPCCEQPDKLKGKPEECTPEQIRECHEDEKDHPCVKGGK